MTSLLKFKCQIAIACVQALLFALAAPDMALAQDKKPLSWENVLKLRNGDAIWVQLLSNERHSGKVDRVEPTGIALTTKEGSFLIPKENIRRMGHVGRPKVMNPGAWLFIGGLGLTVAAMVGGTLKDVSDVNQGKLDSSTGTHGIGLMVAGLGVAAGGVAVMVASKPRTIYVASPSP